MARQEANWTELDVTTLDVELQSAYKAYKDAYAVMKAARVEFEESVEIAAELPAGKRMVFGYNFGKLSVAIVDDDRKAKKPTQAKLSLADYLKQQAAR